MKRRAATRSRRESPLLIRVTWPITALFTILIPVWVSVAGREGFRLPKLVLFRVEGIVLTALLLLAAIHCPADVRERWNFRRLELILPLAILAWALIATCASDDPGVSAASLVTVTAGVAVFFSAYHCGRQRSEGVAWVIIIPALVNAIATFVETRHRWDVWFAGHLLGDFSQASLARVSPVGFMGNRDDLGTLLVPAAVVALAMSVAGISRHKLLVRASAATLTIAIVATKTFTAIAALAVAALVLAALRSWKSGLAAVLLILAGLPAAFYLHPGVRARTEVLWQHLTAGRFEEVVVGRIAPTMAAVEMIRDHPIAGVGPGLFGKNYYRYRIKAAQRYPSLVTTSGWIDYFTDAHDDHLQILAEGGTVAYLLFIAALVAGALASFRKRKEGDQTVSGEKHRLAALAAAPLFVALFILALAQFPLQLAATLQSFLVSAGWITGWSDR